MTSPEWMVALSLCVSVNAEIFFDPIALRDAKSICGRCPAQTACLTYALADRDLVGVWGGTTEKDRDKLRRAAA